MISREAGKTEVALFRDAGSGKQAWEQPGYKLLSAGLWYPIQLESALYVQAEAGLLLCMHAMGGEASAGHTDSPELIWRQGAVLEVARRLPP